VSSIEKSYGPPKPEAEALILSGIEGFKTMRRDVLKHGGKELLLLGAIGTEAGAMPAFYKNWNDTRIRQGMGLRILRKKRLENLAYAQRKNLVRNFEMRILPEEIENPAVINIYGDRVVNVLWKGEYPLCFMMINADIAKAYKQYFEYLWRKSKPFKPT
jgi:hypothetical protein